MFVIVAIILFTVGLGLILYCAERLVRGVVGTSIGFGQSPFLMSVVFIGFDPENLAVGAFGSLEGQGGIALGSIIGSAMVAIACVWDYRIDRTHVVCDGSQADSAGAGAVRVVAGPARI